jgi:membrane fusion protein (multidrug efflux system)
VPPSAPTSSPRRLFLWGGGFLLLALLVVAAVRLLADPGEEGDAGNGPGERAASRTLQVDVVVVEGSRLVDRAETTGFLLANEEVELRFESSGRLLELGFEEGARVEEGRLLARLNDDDLQARRRQLEARRELFRQRAARQRALLAEGGVSREALEETEAELQVLQADLDVVDADLRRTVIRAPFSGVMGLREVSPGAYLTPERVVARLRDTNPLRLEFSLPPAAAGRMATGDVVSFTVEGGGTSAEARIYAIDPGLDEDTRTLRLRARAPNPDGRLLPGAFVRVEVVYEALDQVITVPAVAVRPSPEGPRVFVVREGKAEAVQVETGIRTRDRVQVTRGLEEGDRVILTGFQQLRPGMEVDPSEVEPGDAPDPDEVGAPTPELEASGGPDEGEGGGAR